MGIRAQHIKTETSTSIPIYASTVPKKTKRGNVTGELSTIPGVEVTVTPSGQIRVVKTADPEWDDEKDEAFVDASDDEQQEENTSEKEQTSDKGNKKRKKKDEDKEKKSKKSKTNN